MDEPTPRLHSTRTLIVVALISAGVGGGVMNEIASRELAKARESSSELHKVTFGGWRPDVSARARPHLTIGSEKLRNEDGAGAELVYQHIVEIDPNSSDAWSLLGISQTAQNKHDVAEKSFRRAFELNPNSPEASAGLGDIAYRRRQLPEAISRYKVALKLRPEHAGAMWGLALAYMDSGQLPEAIENFERFLQANPRPSNAAYAREQVRRMKDVLEKESLDHD